MHVPSLTRSSRILDGIALWLVAAGILIALTGGFQLEIGAAGVSARSADRALLLALAVAGVRHARQRRPSMLDRLRTRLEPAFPAAADVPRWRLAREAPVVVIGFVLVTVVVLWPQVRALASVPDLGDPLFSIWRLAWVAHQIPRDPLHLFDANIFHPGRFTLAYSDAMLAPGVLLAPAHWLDAPAVVAYNMALLAAIAASGAAMYALARVLTGSRGAGAAAGAAFGFHAYRFAHYSHFELQLTFWVPLALLAVHRAMRGGRIRAGVLAGVLVTAQIYSSLYYGTFLCLYAAAVAVLLWMAGHARAGALKALAAAVVTIAALVSPLGGPYLQARAQVGDRPPLEVNAHSAEPRDYLAANVRSRLYYPALKGIDNAERQLFPGVAVLVLAGAALVRIRHGGAFVYAGALLLALDCSLGFNGTIYPWLYEHVPPFRAFRVPARFGTFVAVSLSVLAGYGVARLQSLSGRPRAAVTVAACAAAALVIDALPRLSLTRLPLEPPAIYEALPEDAAVVLAEVPFSAPAGEYWRVPSYMYFSTFHWHRLVNGSSGFRPPWYEELEKRMESFPSDEALQMLRELGATHVVVHGPQLAYDEYAAVIRRLDARDDLAQVATAAGTPESRVYELDVD